MFKRLVPETLLVLILTGLLTLTFNIRSVKSTWTGTVYIRADGSIDPPDAPVLTVDNVTYKLTGNIVSEGYGIVVMRGNIVIDGAGYTLQGSSSGVGIDCSGINNVTVKNMNIENFEVGIRLVESSSNNSIYGNNIAANWWCGIYLVRSSNNNIDGNNMTNNYYGIYLFDSSNNSIAGNNIANNRGGIYLIYASNNSINGNNVTANSYEGIRLGGSSNNNISGNNITANNEGIFLYGSSNNSIYGNNIAANWWCGIYLDASLINSISGNNVTNNSYGIRLIDSSNSSIAGNFFVNDGLSVLSSYWNVIVDNLVNGKPLIYLEGISGHTIRDAGQVILINCSYILVESLNLSNTDVGVELWMTKSTTIAKNNIANNVEGICLYWSSNSSIDGNNIANNSYGISLVDSSNNSIHYNNFINNTYQVFSYDSINVWHNGYPSGGNYWSDYTGVDLYSGHDQNEARSDGIGDTPYTIDANNMDRYPLMAPFVTYEAGVWDGISYYVDVISNSTVSDFKFNANQKSIGFNVTGANGTLGFCRVTIPKSLLWVDDGWTILVDSQPVTDYARFEDENNTYLYFTYTHSQKTVTIKGTHAIPEFPTTPILIMLILTTLITTALWKTKRKR